MRKMLFVALTMVALVLVGCQNVTYSASCNVRSGNDTARCEIDIETLTGSFEREIDLQYVDGEQAGPLPLSVTASVEAGTLRISFPAPQGEPSSLEVAPDAGLNANVLTQPQNRSVTIRIESINSTVTGGQLLIEVGPVAAGS